MEKIGFVRLLKTGALAVSAAVLFHAAGAAAGTGGSAAVDPVNIKLENVKQSYMAVQRQRAVEAKTFDRLGPIDAGTPGDWLKKIEISRVNMVTNRVEARGQRAVVVEGRRYYVPGRDYELAFRKNLSLRYTTDPVTGNRIDKSGAAAFADAEGRVFYFENEGTYRNFVSAGGGTPFYGVR